MSLSSWLSVVTCLVLAWMARAAGESTDMAIYLAAVLIICALPSPPKTKE